MIDYKSSLGNFINTSSKSVKIGSKTNIKNIWFFIHPINGINIHDRFEPIDLFDFDDSYLWIPMSF